MLPHQRRIAKEFVGMKTIAKRIIKVILFALCANLDIMDCYMVCYNGGKYIHHSPYCIHYHRQRLIRVVVRQNRLFTKYCIED